jgi:hypothetical protein
MVTVISQRLHAESTLCKARVSRADRPANILTTSPMCFCFSTCLAKHCAQPRPALPNPPHTDPGLYLPHPDHGVTLSHSTSPLICL